MTTNSMTFLQSYFLRCYSAEAGKPRKRLNFSPRGEATFQTFLLTSISLVGLLSIPGLALLKAETTHQFMLSYRSPITVCAGIFTCLLAYAISRRVSASVLDPDILAPEFATRRQQIVGHVQFWSVLLVSLSTPFAMAVLYGYPVP